MTRQPRQKPHGLTIKEGELTVGVEIGYPPMEYLDTDGKTPVGFDVELAHRLAEKLGLKTVFVDTAWDGIFDGVEIGRYDCIISSITYTDERLKIHNFTKPYIGTAQVMIALKGAHVDARSPEETAGLSVAFQGETVSQRYMEKLAAQGVDFVPLAYDKILNCFEELRLGRVDTILCDTLVASFYLSPDNSDFEIIWLGPSDEIFAICLKKGNDALTEALDKALDELYAEGILAKMSWDYFNRDMVSSVR
ncbi:glutamine ABC transporter substrate-binding protein [Leadbettera azotonutricia ZAS-9]|uniref:Glutamine ABC transporter substrate-binding protein n=2 Tax=Leadbettera azotonutricia TaxID=150829 RepID=F5YF49_LEAAZ|nr:glutamine ABC transporter substrate-binding protein [Leadbettera azotonutricia ZAS-9]